MKLQNIAAALIGLLGAKILITGGIHAFLPDGGAGVIAGRDLSQNSALIIGVFAWAGATQMAWGATLLGAAVRWRGALPPLVAVLLVERTIIMLNMWVFKVDTSAAARPPAAYGAFIDLGVVALAIFLLLASRRKN